MSKLQSMLKDKIEAWVEVDGYPGFRVKIAYLARTELDRIRRICTIPSFNKRSHVKEDELDSVKFLKEYVKASVLGWDGLTTEYASRLMPIEVPANTDMSEEIEYTLEDAISLTQNSPEFDRWLNETVIELDSFRRAAAK